MSERTLIAATIGLEGGTIMRIWVGGAAVTLSICAALMGTAHSEASAGKTEVTFNHAAWPSPGLEDAVANADHTALEEASALVDFNKADFAGVYVDPESRVVIVPASGVGQELAQKSNIEGLVIAEPVALSLQEVTQYGLDLMQTEPSVGAKMWAAAINPATDALKIGMFQEPSDEDALSLENFAIKNDVAIDVYIDLTARRPELNSRQEDDSPFAGGFQYAMRDSSSSTAGGSGWCSGGFGYHDSNTKYMLTAGHCFPQGTDYSYMWNTYSGACPCVKKTYAGHRSNSSWVEGEGSVKVGSDNDWHGDVSLVNVTTANKDSGDQIWWGGVNTTNKIPVTQRRVPTFGDQICINGVTSGSDCGTAISDTNGTWVYSSGEHLVYGDRAYSAYSYDCSQHGDSGGSVVFNHVGTETEATAIGIISGSGGSDGGCFQFFTGVEEAMQAWGGQLNFH